MDITTIQKPLATILSFLAIGCMLSAGRVSAEGIEDIFAPDKRGDPSESQASANAAGSSTLSKNYPIVLDISLLNKKGATPNAAYVLLRDLKEILVVKRNSVVTISTPERTLTYTKYSRDAKLNDLPIKLNATPIDIDETSIFPLASLQLIGCNYEPLEPLKTLRKYSLSCPYSEDPIILQAFILKNSNPPATAILVPKNDK